MHSEALGGTQRHSEALRGTLRHSEALRGTLRHSEALRGTQRHSEALRGHQRPSEAIRGHQRPSEAIRGHQRPSEALRGPQRPSEAIRGHHLDEQLMLGLALGCDRLPHELARAGGGRLAGRGIRSRTLARSDRRQRRGTAQYGALAQPLMELGVPVGGRRCGEHLHARQVISGNQRTRELRAAMSTCMQGRSSVAISVLELA